jgi:large subunit ribosomal protein L38
VSIDLSEVKKEWLKTSGPYHIRDVADHYGIFNDLFGKFAYFVPRVGLNIKYKLSDDEFHPVYFGNRIYPEQTKDAPEVSFNHRFSIAHNGPVEENTLWTLILSNPDGNLADDNKECVQWMM